MWCAVRMVGWIGAEKFALLCAWVGGFTCPCHEGLKDLLCSVELESGFALVLIDWMSCLPCSVKLKGCMHSCLVVAAFGLLSRGLLSNLSNEFAGFVYHFAKRMGVGTRSVFFAKCADVDAIVGVLWYRLCHIGDVHDLYRVIAVLSCYCWVSWSHMSVSETLSTSVRFIMSLSLSCCLIFLDVVFYIYVIFYE